MEKIAQNSEIAVHVKRDELFNMIHSIVKDMEANPTPYQYALLEALTALNKLEKFVR